MNKTEKIESRFLNPLTDFGFHRLFGTESSKKFLISFLNEVIRDESLITDIQYFPACVYGNIFEELFQAVETNKLTKKEMKEYKKSVLEYRDVRDSLEFAREEAGKEGWEKGLKNGLKQGREEEKISIILKCFQKNMPVEDIVFLTGFSKEQIIKLNPNAPNRS